MKVLKSLFGGPNTTVDDATCTNNMSGLSGISIPPLTSSQIGSLTNASLGSSSNANTVSNSSNVANSNPFTMNNISANVTYSGGITGVYVTGGGGTGGAGGGGTYQLSSGSAGNVITTNGTGGFSWTSPNTTPWPTMGSSGIHVQGDAEFQGDIKIKGVSLNDRLDKIESRLGILRPNEKLEDKWERLKELGDEYRKLEKEIHEGEKMWDILKK
jgi:hypothetical protein